MPSLRALTSLLLLACSALGALPPPPPPPPSPPPFGIVPPSRQGTPHPFATGTVPNTNAIAIAQTVPKVHQKSGPSAAAVPNAQGIVPPTVVTAMDGKVMNPNTTVAAVAGSTIDAAGIAKRDATKDFTKLFDGLPADQHDGAIEGTAYLTYTLVPNSTYNVAACLAWCETVDGCVFVNLFYEFNNFLLDFVFSEKSNLKCAAYGDIHNATEKTNFGGQPSYPQVGNETVPLTFITQSSGYAANALVNPATPDGYEFVFGPTNGANNAPGYMGFAFIDRYDVTACAQLCNGRGVDPVGGGCSYFNIWRALVDGVPTTYTCAMYYLASNASTAVNTGQGSLAVTFSRGYARKNLVIDGGFEGFAACAATSFCFAQSYVNWIGSSFVNGTVGHQDTTVFRFAPYAHFGVGSALFGAAAGDDAHAGVLTPARRLCTQPGAKYIIQNFFISSFSGSALEAHAKVDVLWNGKRVGGTSGFVQDYTFFQSDIVVGTGSDALSFVGGAAPAWTFLDDVKVFKV
ncbi:hypothetical protein MIND_00650100 [Mycena indigotica]|uniref:Fruit-body specific protein a n=1 Tax=Mycena indigotica TaxID=2126181 RepID=A0A8H6SUI8_9AGAR|nr:uncharacterized protein MIND_00650100 [Mycena indigotica]KAF7304180.1 hypothetical protein MIND_00650100 [Mycena indigotica]